MPTPNNVNSLTIAEDYISQYIAQSTNDFLLQRNHNDMFDLRAGLMEVHRE